MNTNELIKVIETVKSMGYGHIDITHEGTHLMLDEKSLAGVAPATAPVAAQVTTAVAAPVVAQGSTSVAQATITPELVAEASTEAATPVVDDANCDYVLSPIVGTFYLSASPEADPFIKVGDRVKKGDVVCIIEAMKLMNEIEAECDGEVVEVMVNNEAGVEYNQQLFKIKKA